MLNNILYRFSDGWDIVTLGQVTPTLSVLSEDQQLWKRLCQYHFAEKQVSVGSPPCALQEPGLLKVCAGPCAFFCVASDAEFSHLGGSGGPVMRDATQHRWQNKAGLFGHQLAPGLLSLTRWLLPHDVPCRRCTPLNPSLCLAATRGSPSSRPHSPHPQTQFWELVTCRALRFAVTPPGPQREPHTRVGQVGWSGSRPPIRGSWAAARTDGGSRQSPGCVHQRRRHSWRTARGPP